MGCRRLLCIVTLLSMLTSGCVRSYVDTGLRQVSLTEFKAPSQTKPVRLNFLFQTNGAPNAVATRQLMPKVVALLQKTGQFSAVTTSGTDAVPELGVTVNNVGDLNEAWRKGWVVGMTYGLVGADVTDSYECMATYQRPGADRICKTYQHAIHSTIGLKAGPPGIKGQPANKAVDEMMVGLVLNLVRDLSDEGRL